MLVAVRKVMQAVKLFYNWILQFFAEGAG